MGKSGVTPNQYRRQSYILPFVCCLGRIRSKVCASSNLYRFLSVYFDAFANPEQQRYRLMMQDNITEKQRICCIFVLVFLGSHDSTCKNYMSCTFLIYLDDTIIDRVLTVVVDFKSLESRHF